MLVANTSISNLDLDNLIASYGFVEEATNNDKFLLKSMELVMKLTDCSNCYISLLDSKTQRTLSSSGIETSLFPREKTLCQFTLENDGPTIFKNIKTHEQTCHLSLSQGKYSFYAGFPLINSESIPIGALCIMDEDEKEIDDNVSQVLELLADEIANRLDTNRNLIKMIKTINTNFKPADCSNFNCLHGELAHLQKEVVDSKNLLERQSQELHISNKNLTSFAHRVAHDLKAPLRSINSFTTLIKRNLDKEAVSYKEEHFNFVNQSILELNRTIDNLLRIAKLKADSIKPVAFSISQITDRMAILFSNDLRDKEVEFIKPIQDVKILGYPTLVGQLFQNLVSNSIKYRDKSKANAYVKISIVPYVSFVSVSINDNGIGISKEDLANIFKPFNRVVDDEQVKGLGIGLDTCKMIVEDMGATLNVESNVDVGTTFSFDLAYN